MNPLFGIAGVVGTVSTPAIHTGPREDYTTPLNPLDIKGAGESDIIGIAE